MHNRKESNLPQEAPSSEFLDREKMASFSSIILDLQTELYAYLVSRIGGDVSAAEDCLQEVAVVLWNKHKADWKADDYRRFAFRCASIEAKAYHRKSYKSKKRIAYLAPDVVESLSAEVLKFEAEDSDVSFKRLDALKACMEKLDDSQKELLDARYDKDKSNSTVSDIASLNGWGIDATYKRLERIRTALYKCILKRMSKKVL